MSLKTALAKLTEMLSLVDLLESNPSGFGQPNMDKLTGLYGEVEEVIHQFEGIQSILVPQFGGAPPTKHKDFFSAGYLSGRTFNKADGRRMLVKVIGKVRAKLDTPLELEASPSILQLQVTLSRFRECCQYIQAPPNNERAVQDIIWIMLRAQFDRVDREETLPKFGVKSYRPDFGVPDLRTLIEVKFIGPKTELSSIQEELLADVPGYLSQNTRYAGLVIFVYDAAQKLLDPRKFIEDVGSVAGITKVFVIPGIGGLSS
jgi:hypothetical protein